MADNTQAKSTIIAHAAVTHPNSIEGTAVSVATALKGTIILKHALLEATANTNPGTFRIYTSIDASGDDAWNHLMDIDVSDATAATEAMTATEPIAETVLAVASTTGFAAKDNIYVQDAGTLADSEWHSTNKIVSNTSIDIFMGLTNAKDSSDFIWGSAQQFHVPLDFSGLSRIIVHFSHEGSTGANVHVLVEVNVTTDFE